ncbi:MAG: cytochrome c maturation protein CcmE [Alphaproteobacteria bacterium]
MRAQTTGATVGSSGSEVLPAVSLGRGPTPSSVKGTPGEAQEQVPRRLGDHRRRRRHPRLDRGPRDLGLLHDIDEWAVDPKAHADAALRLAGRVSQGSVQWDPKTLDLAFVLMPIPKGQGGTHETRRAGESLPAATAAARLPVSYNGILPDMFADGRDVIVEGRVVDGVFHAKSLLTTCPSKYEAEKQAPADDGAVAGSPT